MFVYIFDFLPYLLNGALWFLQGPFPPENLTKYALRDAFKKKNYVDRETVPIPSYTPTIETVSEYLDREYW